MSTTTKPKGTYYANFQLNIFILGILKSSFVQKQRVAIVATVFFWFRYLEITKKIILLWKDNKACFPVIMRFFLKKPVVSSIEQHIRLYLNQGLTWAEMALCLAVRDNIQISTHHLRRRRARLKLYRPSYFSDAAGSDLEDQICVIINQTLTLDHVMRAHLINYPVITGKRALKTKGFFFKCHPFFVIWKDMRMKRCGDHDCSWLPYFWMICS